MQKRCLKVDSSAIQSINQIYVHLLFTPFYKRTNVTSADSLRKIMMMRSDGDKNVKPCKQHACCDSDSIDANIIKGSAKIMSVIFSCLKICNSSKILIVKIRTEIIAHLNYDNMAFSRENGAIHGLSQNREIAIPHHYAVHISQIGSPSLHNVWK